MSTVPKFNNEQVLQLLKQHYGLDGQLSELVSYADLNKKFTTACGQCFVVKIANSQQSFDQLDFENQVMSKLTKSDLSIHTPKLQKTIDTNALMVKISDADNQQCWMRLITFLDGQLWADVDTSDLKYSSSLGRNLAQIDTLLATIEHHASRDYLDWDLRHANSLVRKHYSSVHDAERIHLIDQSLIQFETQVIPLFPKLATQLIHNDANNYNLLVDSESAQVSGIFDFGDIVHSLRIAELAIAAAYAIMGKENIRETIQTLVLAYHQQNPLSETEIEVLIYCIQIRLALSICMSSYEYSLTPENEYLLVSQNDAWRVLEQLEEIDVTGFHLSLKVKCGFTNQTAADDLKQIIEFRQKHLSENLSLAYQQPLKIIAGKGAYLYDHKGNRYLDMVNNVCHVGHCHPGVVAAGQQQMAVLNTNTRYLHDNIVEFSQQLLSTLPAELSVCMFVNSGSEANELALRLARAHTQGKAMIVVAGAYHGNANACIDISPYKFDGPGGNGEPDWVQQTIVPDPFRGKYRGSSIQTGKKYAADVSRAIEEIRLQKKPFCGFICESIQGVGGQIIHPEGYLKLAYQAVRKAGGVCIADEVQVGMGRVGSHWWAFQTQDVIPDILTIGKPLGNGHPLAAVVTTQAIAQSFVRGMEYFNTFGGNPVSCAIGTAVIKVLKKENLMAHALKIGDYLQQGLRQLQNQFPIIGDVRGLGLFIGVELIQDAHTLEPAVKQADYVIERLKDQRILLTTEGPLHNVLKIKPPLAFQKSDADYFLQMLKIILAEQAAQI